MEVDGGGYFAFGGSSTVVEMGTVSITLENPPLDYANYSLKAGWGTPYENRFLYWFYPWP